jgi:hypothetical protein
MIRTNERKEQFCSLNDKLGLATTLWFSPAWGRGKGNTKCAGAGNTREWQG